MGLTQVAPRRPRWPWIAAAAALTALLTVTLVLGLTARSWGTTLRDEQRLLPGASIGGVDVGDTPAAAALQRIQAAVDPDLDRTITLTHGDQSWSLSPRDLGGITDADAVVAAALERTQRATLLDFVRFRWLGATATLDLDVSLGLDDDAVAAFVDEVAADVDRDSVDATISWTGDGVEMTEGVDGLEVDRAAAADALASAAVDGGDGTIEMPVLVHEPTVTTAAAEEALPAIVESIDARLDRVVTLSFDGTRWSTTAREMGADPDIDAVTSAALVTPVTAGGKSSELLEVPLSFPDEALEDFVGDIAAEIDVAARNAEVRWAGRVEITPERQGRALDRDGALEQLTSALRGDTEEVGLDVTSVQPAVTSESFRTVLVVRQDSRVLERHVDGTITHTWPIAVGQGGAETPTGVFTIGQKRFEPTWYNPAPNGWGADMPEVIGPGPENPLGLRALNWNRNGADTLIRFHGTPNEASIGEAASRGCVRMFNRDVIELYDMTPSGTTILSVLD